MKFTLDKSKELKISRRLLIQVNIRQKLRKVI